MLASVIVQTSIDGLVGKVLGATGALCQKTYSRGKGPCPPSSSQGFPNLRKHHKTLVARKHCSQSNFYPWWKTFPEQARERSKEHKENQRKFEGNSFTQELGEGKKQKGQRKTKDHYRKPIEPLKGKASKEK